MTHDWLRHVELANLAGGLIHQVDVLDYGHATRTSTNFDVNGIVGRHNCSMILLRAGHLRFLTALKLSRLQRRLA